MGNHNKGKPIKQRLFYTVYWPPVNDFQRSVSHREEPLQCLRVVACETVIFWSYKWKIRGMGVEGSWCLYQPPSACTTMGSSAASYDELRVSSVVLKWWNLWCPSVKNKLRKKCGIKKRKIKGKSPHAGILTWTLAELCEVGTVFVSWSLCRRCLLGSTALVIKAHAAGVQLKFKGSSHVSFTH